MTTRCALLLFALSRSISFAQERPLAGGFPPFSNPRFGHAAIVADNVLYVIGGAAGASALSSVEALDLTTRIWSSKAPMPHPRSLFGVATIDGILYAVGGTNGRASIGTVEAYDPRTNQWTQKPPLHFARHGLSVDAVGGIIYAVGGEMLSGEAIPAVEAYDSRTNRWETISQMPEPLFGMASIVSKDEILYFGGATRKGGKLSSALSIEAFNHKHHKWSHKGSLSFSRINATAIRRGTGIFLIGGINEHNAVAQTGEIFQPSEDNSIGGSTLIQIRPGARKDQKAVAVGNTFVLTGGILADRIPTNEVNVYKLVGTGTLADSTSVAEGSSSGLPKGNEFPRIAQIRISGGIEEGSDGGGKDAPPLAFDTKLTSLIDPANAHPLPTNSKSGAIVIGIQAYKNLPRADYARRDSFRFKYYLAYTLGVRFDRIKMLQDEEATLDNLENALNLTGGRDFERLYIYFSGHGSPSMKDGGGLLVPWDAELSDLETTSLPLTRLYSKLERIPAKEIIVFLDACFSGSGPRSVASNGTRPLVNVVLSPTKISPKISVLTAASGNEIAGAFKEAGQGLFTYYLMRSLNDNSRAKTPHLTISQAFSYIRDNVQTKARQSNREQTPQMISANPDLPLF